jgi:predicted kinase
MDGRIIVIRGPICSGKSSIVELIKHKFYNSSLVDLDKFKVAIDFRKSSSWRRKAALKTALYLTHELIIFKRTIIIDIHGLKNQLLQFKRIALKNNYKFYSFLLYPPLKTCLERNKSRNIRDIKYKITDKMIKRYWKDVYRIKGEMVFDSSVLNQSQIAKSVVDFISEIEKNKSRKTRKFFEGK